MNEHHLLGGCAYKIAHNKFLLNDKKKRPLLVVLRSNGKHGLLIPDNRA